MDSRIMQDVSPQDRLQVLKDTAEKAEQFNYPKVLNEDQLSNLKDDLMKDSVNLAKLDEKRKEFLTEIKAKVKPLKQNVAITLTKLRSKVEEVEEEVYLIADQEEGMMGYYNRDGLLVHQRVLLPEERQFRIVDNSKNGTNN